jgi:hypothetical protein
VRGPWLPLTPHAWALSGCLEQFALILRNYPKNPAENRALTWNQPVRQILPFTSHLRDSVLPILMFLIFFDEALLKNFCWRISRNFFSEKTLAKLFPLIASFLHSSVFFFETFADFFFTKKLSRNFFLIASFIHSFVFCCLDQFSFRPLILNREEPISLC